jgi:WD40 repeat protein
VKIWDWEGGEFERTVKGHTKAVMDVDFDAKGTMMGVLCVEERQSEVDNSDVLVRPHDQALGPGERVQQYENAARARSLCVDRTLHAGWGASGERESG